jgi:hypothetical protein
MLGCWSGSGPRRETDHGDRDETEAKFPQGIGGLSVALCDRLGSRPRATAQTGGQTQKIEN